MIQVGRNDKIAVLADIENISENDLGFVLGELQFYGTVVIRRAYYNWEKGDKEKGFSSIMEHYAFEKRQGFIKNGIKDSVDMSIIIEAMELLLENKVEAFCIVADDADYMPLALKIRSTGKRVYIFGTYKTEKAARSYCNQFFNLDVCRKHCSYNEKAMIGFLSENLESFPDAPEEEIERIRILSTIFRSSDNDGWAEFQIVSKKLKDLGIENSKTNKKYLSKHSYIEIKDIEKAGKIKPFVREVKDVFDYNNYRLMMQTKFPQFLRR